MSTKRPHTHFAFKSAITGKFVTPAYAKRNPKITFKEMVRDAKTKKKK